MATQPPTSASRTDDTGVDTSQIMKTLKQKIATQGIAHDADWLATEFDPDLREQLVRLRELASHLNIEAAPRHSDYPIFGSLFNALRKRIHELILFYVGALARQEAALFFVILRILILLARENQALRREVHRVTQRDQQPQTLPTSDVMK